jgi:hypothetical protein
MPDSPETLAARTKFIYQTSYATAHNLEGRGVIESDKMAVEAVTVLLTDWRSSIEREARAAALARAAEKICRHRFDGMRLVSYATAKLISQEILATFPDPSYIDRERLKARQDEFRDTVVMCTTFPLDDMRALIRARAEELESALRANPEPEGRK